MIFLDLDGFKEINERFGHLVGNTVLKEVAELLQDSIRETDVVTRFGGDEFTIVLPETPTEDAVPVARRIRERIEDHVFSAVSEPVHISASFGIATYPDHAPSKLDLVEAADLAMYRAKSSDEQISIANTYPEEKNS